MAKRKPDDRQYPKRERHVKPQQAGSGVKTIKSSVSRPIPGAKQRTAKAEHGTSVGLAFQHIRDLIVHGKLAPGSWVVEGDLCEHLNMSRTPVRGALYLLHREGYVLEYRSSSKSRMIVAPLTKEDAAELYPMIGRIEGLAGRRTALLPLAERKELAVKLAQINEKLASIASDGSLGGPNIFDLDHEFHRLLVAAGAGPRLAAMHQAIEPQTERYWRLYASSIIGQLNVSIKEHQEIIAALLKGDPDRLERTLCANWENGCSRLARVIEMFGERGSW